MNNSGKDEKRDGLYAPGAKVLVVDDNSMNCKLVKSLLKKTGIEVFEAFSGQECLSKVETEKYDVILMDHLMPGMDGIETFRRIRQGSGPCLSSPVIALSANPDTDAKELYNKEGFSCFLKKPVKPALLEQVLADFLPGELVKGYATGAAEASEGEDDSKFDEYDIEGLDWDFAKIHFSDIDTLKETINNFYLMIKRDADRLEEYYKKLEIYNGKIMNEFALSEYRVLVHSMKSSATLIGIIPLAGMAFMLERAAIAKDAKTIGLLNDVFLTDWRSYSEKLKPLFAEKLAKASEFNKADFLAHLKKLEDASEFLDVDSMDPAAKAISEFRLPWSGEDDINALRGAVAALDIDAIKTFSCKLREEALKH
ncbi:MAG: response regulator [Lachnospiraceae bacterium]|nr:response regulator [Lachnospiraceae bacterium]